MNMPIPSPADRLVDFNSTPKERQKAQCQTGRRNGKFLMELDQRIIILFGSLSYLRI
jgi:hypothetical protein